MGTGDLARGTNGIGSWAVRIVEAGSVPVCEVAQVDDLTKLHEVGGRRR